MSEQSPMMGERVDRLEQALAHHIDATQQWATTATAHLQEVIAMQQRQIETLQAALQLLNTRLSEIEPKMKERMH